MRVLAKWGVAVVAAALSAPLVAALGTATLVRDWALHREWRMQLDQAHPERPARLVEVPWNTPARAVAERSAAKLQGNSAAAEELRPVPVVRAGMRVAVWRLSGEAEIHMAGTALETGGVGKIIRVRAGLRNATLRGIVRGPASVELVYGKGWQ